MLRNASFQILIVFLMFGCASSSDDKWYKSANDASGERGAADQKADSLAREVCGCMSSMMASAMGSSEFETMLVDLEHFAELPAAERRARAGEMEQKYGQLAEIMESYERSGDMSAAQCMLELKSRTASLENDPDGQRIGMTMTSLLSSNCRILRVMYALQNEPGF